MNAQDPFGSIAEALGKMVGAVATDRTISAPDLRTILAFLAKVAQVVDQACEDVFAILVELKYVKSEDLRSGRISQLQKQLDLLSTRSRYRDAEEICSRLYHLREQYETQIAPLTGHLGRRPGDWQGVFGLIEEREGAIIRLVGRTFEELSRLLAAVEESTVSQVNDVAARQVEAMRRALADLRELTNQIMGLSGQVGLLELTADRTALKERVAPLVAAGSISVSQDTYAAGQVGAMGPGATAHDLTFSQMWKEAEGAIDLQQLAEDLTQLREAMRAQAETPDQDIALAEIAQAQEAATKGDGPTVLIHLKNAGKWAFHVCTKIGAVVASAALKKALGL